MLTSRWYFCEASLTKRSMMANFKGSFGSLRKEPSHFQHLMTWEEFCEPVHHPATGRGEWVSFGTDSSGVAGWKSNAQLLLVCKWNAASAQKPGSAPSGCRSPLR